MEFSKNPEKIFKDPIFSWDQSYDNLKIKNESPKTWSNYLYPYAKEIYKNQTIRLN